MCLEVSVGCKGFLAMRAFIRPLSRVISLVNLETWSGGEGLLTLRAPVGLLSCVRELMRQET